MINIVAQPGMVIKRFDDENHRYYLIISQQRYAILAWPLCVHSNHESTKMQLDCSQWAKVNVLNLYNIECWQCVPCIPMFDDIIGAHLVVSGLSESIVKNSLRTPKGFVFNDLVFLADHFRVIDNAKNKSRQQLLSALADFFSEGDQDFIDTVTGKEQEEEDVPGHSEDALIDELLKGLEQSDAKEFDSLKPKAKDGKQKAAEVAQWRKWYSEKVKEVKVS